MTGGAKTALEAARKAWAKRSMQLELELEAEEPDECIGTCGRCGAYWDMRHYETCPSCGGYVG